MVARYLATELACEVALIGIQAADRVTGSARGETRDPARHPLRSLPKGVTYHRLAVERTAGGRLCDRVIIDL